MNNTRMSAYPVYGHALLSFQKISQVNKRIFSIHLKVVVFFKTIYNEGTCKKNEKSTKMIYWNMQVLLKWTQETLSFDGKKGTVRPLARQQTRVQRNSGATFYYGFFFSVLVHTPARIMAWSFTAALTVNANIEIFFSFEVQKGI